MKKVLIALDYDPTAQKVAEQGYALAKSLGAEVILLHVVTDPVYYSSTDYSPIMGFGGFMDVAQFEPGTLDALKIASKHFLEKTKLHLGDEMIHISVKEGDIADSILKAAKADHADIIVVGSHSRKWLEDIVIGSVARDVLNHAVVPLFIVPTKNRG
jgi:nucleotide-binding universal stress UspA family protein